MDAMLTFYIVLEYTNKRTLESVIDVGQGIRVGPGRFGKNDKRRAWNKCRAWKFGKKNNRRAGKI